jgi:hypothetical protein
MMPPRRPGQRATSRDREEYARATEAARETRERVAGEVADKIAGQVRELLIEGDIMGGRALVAMRLRQVTVAEARADEVALRAAWMDVCVAAAGCVAALDYRPPSGFNGGRGD